MLLRVLVGFLWGCFGEVKGFNTDSKGVLTEFRGLGFRYIE